MAFEHPLAVLQPGDLNRDRGDLLTRSTWRFLAQGDSWFSIGQLPPLATSNILFNMRLSNSAAAVNLAHPGKTFAQMIDWNSEIKFATYLAGGNLAYQWDAILLSAGGNDLFDAILTMPNDNDPAKAKLRLLQNPELVAVGPSLSRYFRPEGWQAFFSAMEDYFVALVLKRDGAGSKSPGIPIFAHTYDCPQPRPSQAGPGIGPWLSRAFASYQIPEADWMPLTTYIIGQWAQFLGGINARMIARGIANPNIRTVDLVGTLSPAPVNSTGPIGDWENEIHPSPQGYAKLAIALEKQITLT
jgi:hypothetical protein